MAKAGLIVGIVMLLLAIGGGLLSPICVPCLALLPGLAAGYLAGVFDKPEASSIAVRSGASAGALGGAIGLVGQMIAAVINVFMVGPQAVSEMFQKLGINAPAGGGAYYFGAIGGSCCIGFLDIGIMAGLGAAGGAIWFKTRGTVQT